MTSKRLFLLLIAALLAPWAAFAQSSIIYQTDFENFSNNSLPAGWTKVTSGSTARVTTSNVHSGSKSFGFIYTPNNHGTYSNVVALPAFEIVAGTASIEFWSKAEQNSNYCGQFDAGYLTDVTDASTFVSMGTYSYTQHLSYTYIELDMSVMPENARIAFRHRPNTTNYKWYIDDLTVYATSFCCPVPTVANPLLTIGNGTVATLSWTENGDADAWNLQYGTNPDFTPGTYQTMTQGFTVSGTNVTANLTGLTPEQTYYARVQANCTNCGQTSPWVSFRSFKPSNAINLTVNNGSNSNLYIPFYAHNCDVGNQTQFIIPAESLVTLTDSEISKLSFYGCNAMGTSIENSVFSICFKEVDFKYFEDNAFINWDELTEVYQGRLIWDESGCALEFDNENRYVYQGGNLLVAFRQTTLCNGAPYTTSWIGKNQSHNTALYRNGTTAGAGTPINFLPRTTFSYFTPTHPRPWNPTFSNITANSVTASWTAPSANVTAYQYLYKSENVTDWTGPVTTEATSVTLSGLTPEQSYVFSVRALYNDDQVSEFATRVFVTEALCPEPQGIVLNDITGHTATFGWVMVEGANYQYAVTLPNDIPSVWNDVPAGNTCTITGLDAETDYIFYLRRDCSASGNGFSYNNSYSFTTGLACPPPTNVQVDYTEGTTATITWNGNAEDYRIWVSGTPVLDSDITSPYTLAVDYATIYTVGVQALCGGDDGNSAITYAEPFHTELCSPEERCVINYTLTDAYGNGWGYNSGFQHHIRIVDAETGILIENLTMPFEAGSSLSGSFDVCDGRTIEIIWDTAFTNIESYECGFLFTDINNNIICRRVGCNNPNECGDMQQGLIVSYTVNCNLGSCVKPKDFQAIVSTHNATISWTDEGNTNSWNVSYKKSSETIYGQPATVYAKSHTLSDLDPGTNYDVLIVSGCDSNQTLVGSFATYCEANTLADPLTENFEEWIANNDTCIYNDPDGLYPTCWRSYSEGNVYPHIINSGSNCYSHSGNCAMYFKGQANTNAYLALAPYSNANELLVSFWMQTDNYSSGTLGIGYITEGDLNFDTYQELETYANSNTTMVQRHTYLGSYVLPNDATHLVFRWQSNGSSYGVCIDDVTLQLVDRVFNGTMSDSWHDAANWVPSGTPTLDETVFVQTDAIITGAAQAGLVACGNHATLTLNDGGTLMTDNDLIATMKKSIIGYGADNEYTNKGYCLIANPMAETYYNDHIQLSPNVSTSNLLNGTYDLYRWDYTADDGLVWRNYEFLNNQYDGRFNLVNGEAYLYANLNTIEATFTGTATANNIDKEMTTSFDQVPYGFNGWNLFGNPFVCDAYLSDASASEMAFYRMNEDGDGFITALGAIHPMEGIFVQATAAGQSFRFTRQSPDNHSGSGLLSISLSNTTSIHRQNKELYTDSETFDNQDQSISAIDNALIRFGEGNILEKFSFLEGSSKVYIPVEGIDYAVVNASEVGELPLNFKASKSGSYTLSFSQKDISFSYLHLIDNLTGTDVNLLASKSADASAHQQAQGPSYTFNAKPTDYVSRFRLVFATGSSTDGDSFCFINSMGNLCVFGIDGTSTIQMIDTQGHILSCDTFSGSYEHKLNVSSGVYMIRLINDNNVKVQKIVVK